MVRIESHIIGMKKGLEVDVILELVDGRWAAVEIKLSDLKVTEKNVDKLHAFKEKVCGNLLSQVREPEFMAFYCRAW